jgi:hypothetical protein
MNWLALILTLPTRPTAVRVRTWRALKASGCAALRDGVYLLPDRPAGAQRFAQLAAAVQAADGSAQVLALTPRDDAQQKSFIARFDRSAEYQELTAELGRSRRGLRTAPAPAARKTLRLLEQRLDALRQIDFFATEAAAAAQAALDALRHEVEARLAPGEPTARAATRIARLNAAEYRGRLWATRRRPWVDRLASAWLIRRFVDPQARFAWIAAAAKAPKKALGFDYDGAAFTHVADKVTYEVLAASFGLDADARLRRIGEAVHYLDSGGVPSEEAAGLEVLLRGLHRQHADDDALLAAACGIFDALYAGWAEEANP